MPKRPTDLKPLRGIEVMRGEMPIAGMRGLLSELVKQSRLTPIVPRAMRAAKGIFDEAGRYLAPAETVNPAYAAHVASSVSKHVPRVPVNPASAANRAFADAQVANYLRKIR